MAETIDAHQAPPDGWDDERALEAYLLWLRDAGLDFPVSETPVDRFAEAAAPRRAPRPEFEPRALEPARPQGPTGADAARAQSLDELRDLLERFEGLALKATASRLVFEDGSRQAEIMLVGEAPGAEEDRLGKPFVGRAGHLLDRMLAAIGLDRAQVYIANVVPWRPPGNRTPTPQETAACLPFVTRQIELVRPKFLLCLGASSARALLGIEEGILKARGRWRAFETAQVNVKALATLHPAYLLRQPAHKRLAWRDLRALKAAVDQEGAAAPRRKAPENP
jgi:DNA polymerase